MQRSSTITIPRQSINFSTFIHCLKCEKSFTDSNPAYAIHECFHLFCQECVHFELEDEMVCFVCQSPLTEPEFHRKLPEWSRLEIAKKYFNMDLQGHDQMHRVRGEEACPEATQVGLPQRMLQFTSEEMKEVNDDNDMIEDSEENDGNDDDGFMTAEDGITSTDSKIGAKSDKSKLKSKKLRNSIQMVSEMLEDFKEKSKNGDNSILSIKNINKPTKKYGETPFHSFCKAGNLQKVKICITDCIGLDTNVICHNGYSILLDVLQSNIEVQTQYSIIDMLCDSDIYPSPVFNNSVTALSFLLQNLTGNTAFGHISKQGEKAALTLRKLTLYEEFIKKLCYETSSLGKITQREFSFTEIDREWVNEVFSLNCQQVEKRDPHVFVAIKDLCKKLLKLEVTDSGNYYKFMLEKLNDDENSYLEQRIEEIVNIDELKPDWPLFKNSRNGDATCIVTSENRKFIELGAKHLTEIIEHSKKKSKFMITSDNIKITSDNKKELISDKTPLYPKFVNYLNFCSNFNLTSKLLLFKNYTFFVTTSFYKPNNTPGKRRSSRRKTPPQTVLKLSVQNDKDKTSQNFSNTQNYIALLKSLGAQIRASQPYSDDETVQAHALENMDKVQYTCLEQNQVCFYILYLGENSEHVEQCFGPVRIVGREWLYECVENYKIYPASF